MPQRYVILALCCLALAAPSAASAAAPDPGGDQNAPISLPPAGKEFGFSGLFNPSVLGVGAIDSSVTAGLIQRAGGNAARLPMSWWGLEPNRDQWSEALWATYATTYSDMIAKGITPHFVLMSAPPWARDPGAPQSCLSRATCIYPPARSMLGQWQQFVQEVVRRFPKATIEIWNEPNFAGNWRTGVDPARYAELLASAYDAAKAVNPGVDVLSGGLGASIKANSLTIRQFLDGAYAASPSLKGHTDAINFHVYPGWNLGAGSTFAQVFKDVRDIRAKYGDQATPLYLSETGATTSGAGGLSEADQSDLVLRTVRKTLTMPDVSGVLLYTLVDQPQYSADDPEYGFGLLHYSTASLLAPKAAYCQLTQAAGQAYSLCPPVATIDSVDTRAPAAPRVSVPAAHHGHVGSHRVTFSIKAGEAGLEFKCRLDRARARPCGASPTFRHLASGRHALRARAVDAAGNVSAPGRVRVVVN